MRKISDKAQIKKLMNSYELLNKDYQSLATQKNMLADMVNQLQADKRWLQLLVQEMSSTMNNGSKEGAFPRR